MQKPFKNSPNSDQMHDFKASLLKQVCLSDDVLKIMRKTEIVMESFKSELLY